ncbi:MAG: cation-transporting P-type ATPase, partial [Candidatus Nitrosopolaris sp.]
MTNQEPDYYWSIPTADLFRQFDNTITEEGRRRQQQLEVGLTSAEANLRLLKYGKNMVESKKENRFVIVTNLSIQKSNNSYFYLHLYFVIFPWSSRGCFNHYFNRNCKR